MIIPMMAAAAMLAGASAEPRQAYAACLKDAAANAKDSKVSADGFKAYAQQSCAAAEDSFRKVLAAFNVKNGMGKKSAVEDAQVQIDDYVYTADENYRFSFQLPKKR